MFPVQELLRHEVSRSRGGGVPFIYVVLVGLIGIILGYLLKRSWLAWLPATPERPSVECRGKTNLSDWQKLVYCIIKWCCFWKYFKCVISNRDLYLQLQTLNNLIEFVSWELYSLVDVLQFEEPFGSSFSSFPWPFLLLPFSSSFWVTASIRWKQGPLDHRKRLLLFSKMLGTNCSFSSIKIVEAINFLFKKQKKSFINWITNNE